MPLRKLALVLVLLVCVSKAALHRRPSTLEDFRVYDTAAMLVREHHSNLIYDGADGGTDPQLRLADSESAFATTARRIGFDQVRLYVYPPLLADAMVPFTYASVAGAGRLWIAANLLAVVAFALLVRSMLLIPWKSLGLLALLIGTMTYLPVLDCLKWGQVTIFLLFLWTLGVFCYARGWKAASAAAFAVATAIKLTPLIVLAPFLLWREWRWVRYYFMFLLACVGLTCVVNGPGCLTDYFRHVMPAMSNGNSFIANKSLLASFQILYVTLKGGDPTSMTNAVPKFVSLLGKAAALGFLLAACALVARHAKTSSLQTRRVTLALFAMLSTGVSPVSWEHAYAVCLLALVCLWAEAIRAEIPTGYLVFLTLSSLELSWFLLSFFVLKRVHGVAFGMAIFLTPLSAIGLAIYRLVLGDSPLNAMTPQSLRPPQEQYVAVQGA